MHAIALAADSLAALHQFEKAKRRSPSARD